MSGVFEDQDLYINLFFSIYLISNDFNSFSLLLFITFFVLFSISQN